MSEAQVADNKPAADANKPAVDKPADNAATASASTKLLDSCTNNPAETKTEGSTATASTDANKETTPTVKEDHVDSLLRGDQQKDGSEDKPKTSTCQDDYLKSLEQGVKPAEAKNTANLHNLDLKEEQVATLPKDAKEITGDGKFKVFQGPDGKRYFQKGDGAYTVLELSADGKHYEGTSNHGNNKVVMGKDNDDAVKVLDQKGKEVEKFEKSGGGNAFTRGWNSFTGAVSDVAGAINDNVIQPYVVQPISDAASTVSKAIGLDSIFSDEKWDFSTDSKDVPAPPPPPEDFSWLDASLNDSEAFWNEYDVSLLDFEQDPWATGNAGGYQKGEARTVFFSESDVVSRSGGKDGVYTLKHGNEEIQLSRTEGGSQHGGKFEGTLASGEKVVYDRAQGTLNVGDRAIERAGDSKQVREVPEGSTRIAADESAGKEVWQGPDGKRYIRDGRRDFTVMEVSADGSRWEGTLKNGSKVVMDKNDPEYKFKIVDHEGNLVDRVTKDGKGILHTMGDKTTAVFQGPPPKTTEEMNKLEDGVYSYVDGGKVTRIIKGDGLVAVARPDGQIEMRLNGRRFGRETQENGGQWRDLENQSKPIPADVQAKLNSFVSGSDVDKPNVLVDNMVVRSRGRNQTADVVVFNTPEEAQVCAETNVCEPGKTPGLVGIVTDKPGSPPGTVQMQDFEKDQSYEVKPGGEIQVTSISTGEEQWSVKDGTFHDDQSNWSLSEDKGFWDDSTGFGMDASGNIYDDDGTCIYDDGWAESSGSSAVRQQEFERSEAVGDAEIGKASSLISPARGVIYGAFDPATAESLCSAAYSGLSGAINLAMSCGNTAMAGELMSKQAEASSWIYISSGARKATTQHSYELPGGGGGMSFMMAEAARSTASGVSPTTAFENMLVKVDPTNPRVAYRSGQANPVSLTWTDSQRDSNNRAA